VTRLTNFYENISHSLVHRVYIWPWTGVYGMPLNDELQLDEYSLVTPELMKSMPRHPTRTFGADELAQEHGAARTRAGPGESGFRAAQTGRPTVDRLAGRLHKLRRQVAPAVWPKTHPFGPATSRGAIFGPRSVYALVGRKPRGYSGDASLLDIYYKHPVANEIVASSTSLGRQIYAYTSEAASSVAGRERRDILTRACGRNGS